MNYAGVIKHEGETLHYLAELSSTGHCEHIEVILDTEYGPVDVTNIVAGDILYKCELDAESQYVGDHMYKEQQEELWRAP